LIITLKPQKAFGATVLTAATMTEYLLIMLASRESQFTSTVLIAMNAWQDLA